MTSDEVRTVGHVNWHAQPLLGIPFNEVGNLSDLFNEDDKRKFNIMMSEAFILATGNRPQLHWRQGAETMAAFRSEVEVECLAPLIKMPKLDPWRTADRYFVCGVTEHGRCKLLLYNQHQPASNERRFPFHMRIAYCVAILRDAIKVCDEDPECCGWGWGGDGKCGILRA